MSKIPLIAIVTRGDGVESSNLPRYSVIQQYAKVLAQFGAAVILIPPQSNQHLTICFEAVDGLLLAGGHDLSFGVSEQEVFSKADADFDLERDRTESLLTKMALEKNLPLLGICRGMQLLNVISGGTVLQDIYASKPDAIKHSADWREGDNFHETEIIPNTKLSKLADYKTTYKINGNHHQCIDKLGDDIIVSAVAADGVIEAIERPSKNYVLGVQWHPEWMTEDNLSQRIFSSFVAAARNGY
jgi:putative glutamine amidotransferase